MRVLVVDDNVDVADSMSAMLELAEQSWKIQVAYGGAEALTAAWIVPPDAVILDVAMPGLTGLDVAQHLRERFGPRVVIVAFTGCSPSRFTAAELSTFDHVVLKPAEVEALVEAIKTAMGGPGDRGRPSRG